MANCIACGAHISPEEGADIEPDYCDDCFDFGYVGANFGWADREDQSDADPSL